MKHCVHGLILLALSVGPVAQAEDDTAKDQHLKVADIYARCGAYYEIAASVLRASKSPGVADAEAMKAESMIIATSIAADGAANREVTTITENSFAAAIEEMLALIKTDPDAFRDWAEKERQQCRMAVNDPPTFVDRKLAELSGRRRSTQYITVPKDLTVEKILKYGTPVTGVPDPSKCAPPGRDVTISLDDVKVEGGMVCAQHEDAACDRDQEWLSFRQYIESLYPDHEFNGYTQTLSISFKDGQRQDRRTLVACLVLPETAT